MDDNEAINKLVEYQVRIVSASYDKLTAYTNLIIFAGYASFFGLWHLTKDILPAKQAVWSALSMLISVSIFVVFEIAKTYYQFKQNQKLSDTIFTPENKKTPQALIVAFEKFENEKRIFNLKFHKFWFCTFVPTVIFGLLANFLLMVTFVSKLLS